MKIKRWNNEEIEKLLKCKTEKELQNTFPDLKISSLNRYQRQFRDNESQEEIRKIVKRENSQKSFKKLFIHYLELNSKNEAQLMWWGDLHYGAPTCQIEFAEEMLDYCVKKHIYVEGMGDYVEMATRVSPGLSLYNQRKVPQDQIDYVTEMLIPVARKGLLLGLHTGNHEDRCFSLTGVNIVKNMCKELSHYSSVKVKYFDYSAFHLLNVGKQKYEMFTAHGSSGSRTPETKLRAVRKYAEYINTEIIAIGHMHDLLSSSFDHYRINPTKRIVEFQKVYYVITGSYLAHEGSYAEKKAMIPGQLGSPKGRFLANEHKIFVSF